MKFRLLLLACGLAAAGCDRTETVSIGLDPDPFDIVTQGTQNEGEGSIAVDPSDAGSDYLDNKADIDSAALASLKLEILAVNASAPANVATQLVSGGFEVTDDVTSVTHLYRVDPSVLPLAILAGATYDLGVIEADPSDPAGTHINDFLSSILKAGNPFTVVARGAVDAGPVNITCRLHFDVNLEVSIGLFD